MSKIKNIVYYYIENCYICTDVKAPKNYSNCFLMLLLIFISLYTNIFFNFITKSLFIIGYNKVLMMIDKLTKKRYYISCSTEKLILQLKLLNIYYFTTLKNFMIYLYESVQIIALIWF